ncbi:MAG: hypothetical protein ORN57_01385 [Alphaproteobacteria bacterium]|nr:hypothetical protein [Alphaproteobacteria bacterium]
MVTSTLPHQYIKYKTTDERNLTNYRIFARNVGAGSEARPILSSIARLIYFLSSPIASMA